MMASGGRSSRKGSLVDKSESEVVKCVVCSEQFAKKDKYLQCALCETYFHIACQDIDDDTYEAVLKDRKKETPLIQLYCSRQCNKAASKVLNGVMQLEKEVKRLNENVEKVNGKVDKIDGKVNDMEKGIFKQEHSDAIRRIVRDEVGEELLETIEQSQDRQKESEEKAISEAVRELKERDFRKKNFLIFGVPMCKSDDYKKRIDFDKQRLKELVREGLGIKRQIRFKRVTRLGKKEDNDRPMRITMEREDDVTDILRASKNIKENPKFKNVSFNNDRTPLERAQRKKLVVLRKKLQAESDRKEENVKWVIKNDRVVKERAQQTVSQESEEEEEEEDGNSSQEEFQWE